MRNKALENLYYNYYLPNIFRVKKMRRDLKNSDFSLLCPDCMGGIIYHDLGLEFLSPNINLSMTQTDFLKYLLNFEDYKNGRFEEIDDSNFECPCGLLYTCNNSEPVELRFAHYSSFDEAVKKWNERIQRINYDNLFIVLEQLDGITYEDILKLSKINARGIVAFTAEEYKDVEYCVPMKKYFNQNEIGNILKINRVSSLREYEEYFDFVKWFNESDGIDYNVKNYIRKK